MRYQVLRYIHRCELMRAGDRVLLAVSGGADSVALLRLLLEVRAELGIVLAVAHFNHGLRGRDSDADEHFVVDLARRHKLDYFVEQRSVAEHAAAERMSVESAGRELRYDWLTKVAAEHRFDSVATAHTLDDQAETVLMKFLRGAGSRGLAGIYPVLRRGHDKEIRFVRPLLSTTRAEIEAYLESLDQDWREDESNLDRRFRRNRVRHELLPLLEREYNPNIRQVLSETAEINRADEAYWNYFTWEMLGRLRVGDHAIRVAGLAAVPDAMQRRVLRRLLDELSVPSDFQQIERLRLCALGELPRAELSNGWRAEREGDVLVLRGPIEEASPTGYRYRLSMRGEIEVPEIDCVLRAVPVPTAFAAEADPGTLLRADLMSGEVWVRNWQPGDRYHMAYSGREHKLKSLFLERKIPVSERALWPVMVKETDIVWVRDLPVADAYCWRPGDGAALRVECIPVRLEG